MSDYTLVNQDGDVVEFDIECDDRQYYLVVDDDKRYQISLDDEDIDVLASEVCTEYGITNDIYLANYISSKLRDVIECDDSLDH